MAKKLALIVFGFIALILVVIVAVPVFVDVDKYRPQIVTAANEHINGKLELGKLSLSLWGQVRVEVAGLSVSDSTGRSVLSVKDAYFHLPFSSLLSGSPEVTFFMDKPQIAVVKDKAGKMNLLSLMKVQGAAAASQTAPGAAGAGAAAQAGKSEGKMVLPGIATAARLGIELKDADVAYKDLGTGLESKTSLDVSLKDISLSRPTQISVTAGLDTRMAKIFSVKGPLSITGKISPTLKDGQLGSVDVTAQVNMDALDIAAGGLFEKKPGMAASTELALNATPDEVKLQRATARFFDAEIRMTGDVSQIQSGSPMVSFSAQSNDIDLKPWAQLIPMLKDYSLAGNAHLDAGAQGPASKLGYHAKFSVSGLTAKAPQLKAEPRVDLLVDVVTDRIENFSFSLKAPGNDLKVTGKVASFAHPRAEFQVSSPGMDLDQLVRFPQASPKQASSASSPANSQVGKAAPAAKPQDVDALLEPIRDDKELADASASVGFNLKLFKAYGVKITNLSGKLYFKNLTAGLDGFAMKVWDGVIKSSFSAQLKPKTPTYSLSAGVEGLDIAQAADSQLHLFRNTVLGKAHFNISGTGASFNTQPAMANLKAKGGFKVDHATFATVDVSKMVADGLNGAISQVADKVPQLKGKAVGMPPGGTSKYEVISSSFSINGGKFSMPDFVAKAEPKQGIDLKGSVNVGLLDYSLSTDWEVIDTYDVTGAKEISVSFNGVNVPHLLAEGNGPVKFPVHAEGTIMQPKYSYTQVPEALTRVAMGNVSAATTGAAKSQVKQKIQNMLPPSVPQNVRDKLNSLFN